LPRVEVISVPEFGKEGVENPVRRNFHPAGPEMKREKDLQKVREVIFW